jgi:two-component system, OmpR family, sensor kinase
LLKGVRRLPIRWQITSWFSGLLAVVLLFFGLSLYFTLQTDLLARIDESLKRRATEVRVRLEGVTQAANLNPQQVSQALEINPLDEFADPGVYVQILDRQGKVLGDSSTLGQARLPIDPALVVVALNGQTSTGEAQVANEKVRIFYQALVVKNQLAGVMEVGESLKPYTDTLNRVRLYLVLGAAVALLISVLGGWWVTRRALRPVVRVSETARRIAATRDFEERIPQSLNFKGQHDEISELAATFNRMIEELGRVFDVHRQFMADTSHELRTPLTIIQGNLDLLKRGLPPAEAAEAVEETSEEAARLSRLVSDLLMLAQADAGMMVERAEVDLAVVVRRSFHRAEQLAESQAKPLKLSLGRLDPATVIGDEYRLDQAIFNLLDNAVRYTQQGEISLSLAVAHPPNGPAVARISVKDSGPGIAQEHLGRLFTRFYRVDKARSRALGGTGLGLAIVKYIVEAHNGQVRVESQPGVGSVFEIIIPLA